LRGARRKALDPVATVRVGYRRQLRPTPASKEMPMKWALSCTLRDALRRSGASAFDLFSLPDACGERFGRVYLIRKNFCGFFPAEASRAR